MDITNALRFVDDEGLAVLAEAEELLAGHLAPPYGGIRDVRAAHVIKGLQRLVRELHDRLEMADSFVETATQAVADELKVPCLTFDKVHDALGSAARNGDGPPTEALCPAESIMQWASNAAKEPK